MTEIVAIREALLQARAGIRGLCADKHVAVCDDLPRVSPVVLGHTGHVVRILTEFLRQLIVRADAGDAIQVTAAASEADRVTVSVCLSAGRGIGRSLPDEQPVDGGLGLLQCRQWAREMNGRVRVALGAGGARELTLELRVALLRDVEAAVDGARSKAIATTTPVVLYIEDNAANRRLMESVFRSHPELSLICATTGEQGLELALSHRPRVVLVDIHLPGMNGFDMVRALRAVDECRHIPAIGISADAAPTRTEDARAAGMLRYLTKPVAIPELLSTIFQVLQAAPSPAAN